MSTKMQQLYHTLCEQPFPYKAGSEIMGIDLVYLDSSLMGFSQYLKPDFQVFNNG